MSDIQEVKKRIPVKEGLFRWPLSPGEEARLVASECLSCGEILFPKRQICTNCQGETLKEITLSRRGKIYSFSVVMQRPGRFYEGPVPYAFGYAEFPEGVRIEGLIVCDDFDALRIGMDVELVIERLYDDKDGNEVVAHKFRVIEPQKKN